jgi:capsular polysaccharide export protein
MSEDRTFLFLQGPPGPLFRQLGQAMAERGAKIHRINICGGDYRDWPEGAVDFRGRFSEWPAFFDRYLCRHKVTDILLFGDCRPYHVSACGIAEIRGVRTHVLEEGYLRPDWMTLELEGVNARSTLPRDKHWFLREAQRLPPEPQLARVTASFRRRARDSYWYYHNVFMGQLRFPHYRTHRASPLLLEGIGWLWKFGTKKRRWRKASAVLRALADKPIFVLPLQLSNDFQIRTHSLFADMQSAAAYAIESFAMNAPPEVHLVLKSHPLDPTFFSWSRFVQRIGRRLGMTDRLHFVDGGDLNDILACARGLVCVNSTSATLALARGIPVCTIGEAIYDMQGLTHQWHVDSFWLNPTPPEPGVYEAFRRVLVDRCLVRGGLASESAVELLTESILHRLRIGSGGEIAERLLDLRHVLEQLQPVRATGR